MAKAKDNTAQLLREKPAATRNLGRPFQPGHDPRRNKGGRPRGTVSLRHALERIATQQDADAAIRRLIASAKKGSLQALKLWAEMRHELGKLATIENNFSVTQPVAQFAEVQILIPSNGRDSIPVVADTAPPVHELPPVTVTPAPALPAPMPEAKPAPVGDALPPVEAKPEPKPKIDPRLDPQSPAYVPACFRRAAQ